MSQTGQNYKNHIRWFPPFHFFILPVMLINFLVAVRNTWLAPSGSTAFACLVAAAFLGLTVVSRLTAVAVQDRLIRLEMRLRLRESLPADLQRRVGDLTADQLVALRFAGDAEMPDLVRQVLAGQLKSRKEIKLKVQDWQGDYLRA